MGRSGEKPTDADAFRGYGVRVEDVRQNELIETLKKLIQGEKALVRQMKRTIAVVDETLHPKSVGRPDEISNSDRDIQ